MKIIDFTDLTLLEKLELLYNEGVLLGKRKQGATSIILYQFEKLYVEIFYHNYRTEVSHIICTECTDIVHPYIAQIDISELLN